jgi:hypothetical protein
MAVKGGSPRTHVLAPMADSNVRDDLFFRDVIVRADVWNVVSSSNHRHHGAFLHQYRQRSEGAGAFGLVG